MAETFDVASRLAQGLPHVDDIAVYVWACRSLGYQDADLTGRPGQVHDAYGSEDGLDLRSLHNDCTGLDAAVSAIREALARQGDQLAEVSSSWQGRGADASREFLRRHHDTSAVAASAARTAAEALASLRDKLWGVVDAKVSTTMTIGQRAQAEWLAAAQTVATGAGDRATASELIDQRVKPFVDNDIRGEWLTAMRSATAAVDDLYDAAMADLTAERDAVFDVPGDFGPSWSAPSDDGGATRPAAAVPVAAAPSWSPPSWSPPSWSPPQVPAVDPSPPPAPAPVPAPVDPAATAPAMASPPSMPSLGGMPDVGSGLSGIGQQIADALSGLLGSADDAVTDPPELDDPEIDEPELDEDKPDDPDEETEEGKKDSEPVEDPVVDETAEAPGPVEEPPPAEPVATPIPPPVEGAPLPPEPQPAAPETPCEIAADELPQVGE
jgi:hypothetical protein